MVVELERMSGLVTLHGPIGTGRVAIRDLVIKALRMRPERIIVGECRSGEALDMLQAMNTGHNGSLTTLHANSPRDAMGRLETLVLMAGVDLPVRVVREQIRSAYRATGSDAVVFVVTLMAAFLLKLDTAIYVGVGVSLALYLRKASAPSLVEYGFNDAGHLAQIEEKAERKNPAISIVHVEGELFFGAADLFQEQVRYLADEGDLKVIILRMKNARHLDATSVMSLMQLHEYLQSSGRYLLVSGISRDVERVLKNSGAWETIGPENIFPAEANLTMSTKRALQRASQLLQIGKGRHTDVRIFYDRRREQATEPPGEPEKGNAPDQAQEYEI